MANKQPMLAVVDEKVSELLPYANNAKIHSEYQIDQIVKSIEEFGFNDPIAVWENKRGQKEIVEGHGRVLAARKLGMEYVPCIYLNHLSDRARRAYTHIHNQLTLNSGFDIEVLEDELAALNDLAQFDDLEKQLGEFDWESFGFEPSGLEWDSGVDELTDDSYEEPEKEEYRCPNCGHVDTKAHFVKA